MTDYDEPIDETAVDEDEAQNAEKGAKSEEATNNENDRVEAESLTVTAKYKQREALEDEVAAFLARGGKITEVPPEEE